LITSLILGCFFGIFTGLLPGLGLFSGLVLIYPYLKTLDVSNIIIFYISMAAASQYTGSISAIVLKIPGEANSVFALKESKILDKQGKTDQALGACAIGSVVGGAGAIILTWSILPLLEPMVPYMFRSDVKAIILLLSLCAFIYFSDNKLIISLVFSIIGFCFSLVGISPFGVERTFGIEKLVGGIPWYPVILGVLIIPKLFEDNSKVSLNSTNVKFYFNFWITVRSTILGYVGGLVPGISYIIGPKLAWIVENKISGDSLKRLLAAETANNASAYSMIIPLLLLSVPIVSSEAIILDLCNNKGFQFNWNTTIASGWFSSTIIPIIIINVFLGFISYYCIKWLTIWRKIPKINIFISLLLILSLIINANDIQYEMLLFFLFFGLGFVLRKFDTLPIVLTFLMGDQIEQNVIRVLTIYNYI